MTTEEAMTQEHQFQFIAGMMVRKHFRQMLESEVFAGRNIRWMEQKRWLESIFYVRGADAKLTEERIDEYMKVLGT